MPSNNNNYNNCWKNFLARSSKSFCFENCFLFPLARLSAPFSPSLSLSQSLSRFGDCSFLHDFQRPGNKSGHTRNLHMHIYFHFRIVHSFSSVFHFPLFTYPPPPLCLSLSLFLPVSACRLWRVFNLHSYCLSCGLTHTQL